MSITSSTLHLRITNHEGTELLGVLLGEILQTPLLMTLEGALGAGKTAFTRGLVEGIAPGEGDFVSSPTYAVCNIYPTIPPVYHYDLYRLESEDDLESVGFYDSVDQGVLVIEWPQRVPSVFERAAIQLSIEIVNENTRDIRILAANARGAQIVKVWRNAIREETSGNVRIIDDILPS